MGIYDQNGNLITELIQTATSRPDVVEIKNRLLDGSYHVQTIGEGGTLLDVEAHFTKEQKDTFDLIKRTMSEMKVIFDGKYYKGLIDGQPTPTRKRFADAVMYGINFTLMVNDEGVA